MPLMILTVTLIQSRIADPFWFDFIGLSRFAGAAFFLDYILINDSVFAP